MLGMAPQLKSRISDATERQRLVKQLPLVLLLCLTYLSWQRSQVSNKLRIYMLTRPVAAARAAVATGESGLIETRHVSATWKCDSLSFIFTHPPEDNRIK